MSFLNRKANMTTKMPRGSLLSPDDGAASRMMQGRRRTTTEVGMPGLSSQAPALIVGWPCCSQAAQAHIIVTAATAGDRLSPSTPAVVAGLLQVLESKASEQQSSLKKSLNEVQDLAKQLQTAEYRAGRILEVAGQAATKDPGLQAPQQRGHPEQPDRGSSNASIPSTRLPATAVEIYSSPRPPTSRVGHASPGSKDRSPRQSVEGAAPRVKTAAADERTEWVKLLGPHHTRGTGSNVNSQALHNGDAERCPRPPIAAATPSFSKSLQPGALPRSSWPGTLASDLAPAGTDALPDLTSTMLYDGILSGSPSRLSLEELRVYARLASQHLYAARQQHERDKAQMQYEREQARVLHGRDQAQVARVSAQHERDVVELAAIRQLLEKDDAEKAQVKAQHEQALADSARFRALHEQGLQELERLKEQHQDDMEQAAAEIQRMVALVSGAHEVCEYSEVTHHHQGPPLQDSGSPSQASEAATLTLKASGRLRDALRRSIELSDELRAQMELRESSRQGLGSVVVGLDRENRALREQLEHSLVHIEELADTIMRQQQQLQLQPRTAARPAGASRLSVRSDARWSPYTATGRQGAHRPPPPRKTAPRGSSLLAATSFAPPIDSFAEAQAALPPISAGYLLSELWSPEASPEGSPVALELAMRESGVVAGEYRRAKAELRAATSQLNDLRQNLDHTLAKLHGTEQEATVLRQELLLASEQASELARLRSDVEAAVSRLEGGMQGWQPLPMQEPCKQDHGASLLTQSRSLKPEVEGLKAATLKSLSYLEMLPRMKLQLEAAEAAQQVSECAAEAVRKASEAEASAHRGTTSELLSLRTEVASARSELAQARLQIAKSEDEKLQAQARQQQLHFRAEEEKKAIGKLQALVAELQATAETQSSELRRKEREAADLQAQLHTLGSELAAKTTELARHQLDLTRASALLEDARAAQTHLTEQLSHAMSDLRQCHADLRSRDEEGRVASHRLESQAALTEQLRKDKAQIQDSFSQLQQQASALQLSNSELQGSLRLREADLAHLRVDRAQLLEQADILQQQVATLKGGEVKKQTAEAGQRGQGDVLTTAKIEGDKEVVPRLQGSDPAMFAVRAAPLGRALVTSSPAAAGPTSSRALVDDSGQSVTVDSPRASSLEAGAGGMRTLFPVPGPAAPVWAQPSEPSSQLPALASRTEAAMESVGHHQMRDSLRELMARVQDVSRFVASPPAPRQSALSPSPPRSGGGGGGR